LITGFGASPAQVDLGNATVLGVAANEGATPLTYQYGGLPTGCTNANLSALPCTPTALGRYVVQVTVTDPTGQNATAAVGLTVVPVPSVVAFSPSVSPASVGVRSLLTATVGNGTPPYAYAYSGLPLGCVSQTVPSLPCTPAASGNYTVTVTIRDAFDRTAAAGLNLTVQPAGGAGAPAVLQFAANPSALVLGNSTNLTEVVYSPLGPVTVSYTGLPPGCASANVTPLACTPTAAGAYTVNLTATDVLGNSTTVPTTLTVYPVLGGGSLSVSAFSPNRPAALVDETVTLHVVATGGDGPLTYAYAGLPPGCASQDTATLPCTPNAAGTFRITATVSDAGGDAAQVPLRLVVDAAISGTLVLVAFVPVPAAIPVGGTTILTANVTGGSSGRTFAYSGLPSGCAGADTPTLPCTPMGPGLYRIGVTVADGAGDRVNATTVLRVAVGATVPPPATAPAVGFTTDQILTALLAVAVLLGVVGYLAGRRRPPTGSPAREATGSPPTND